MPRVRDLGGLATELTRNEGTVPTRAVRPRSAVEEDVLPAPFGR